MSESIGKAHTVKALRAAVAGWRAAGDRVALVPTMGALHAGHIALVRAARRRAQRVIVSIFVNPAQFAPNEDFSRYPRPLAADLAKIQAAHADLVYLPTPSDVYPDGFATTVSLTGPALELESAFRPSHFAGVATVVAKLLTRATPDFAFFGEKDYQQLQVVTRMARDLDLPVRIVGVPTIREADGLALSSRNIYLSAADRAAAPTLYAALTDAAIALRNGAELGATLDAARDRVTASGFRLDYLEARHADTLARVKDSAERPMRLLVAAHIGTTRLIDNLAV